ncbi:MAG: hypothetical protein CVU49_06180 [Candidatus Cloacimonetes bacterium HGW-Cloacimonetes-2]|jgi:hypothetical protein|nr:MAG: hypothetical protein CVU49_06180 [Candidatus Cloacimonetes bacterium HGW-Cloacimonetes-2]
MERYPNIRILLNLPQRYIPKAEFVLRTYCYILRLSPTFSYGAYYEGAHLYYGPDIPINVPIKIIMDAQTPAFFEERELYPLERVNFCKFKGEKIPFLFSKGGSIFALAEDHCTIRKDIVGSGFYFLTCWHEYILGAHGPRSGRVDYRQSLQYRWDFTEVPVVDVYAQILLYTLQQFCPEFIRDISWAENKRFVVSLSHDIDYWDYWSKEQKASNLKYNLRTFPKRPLSAAYKILAHGLHKNLIHNPWRIVKNIARDEAESGVSATWFLLARGDFEDSRQNYLFDVVAREQILDNLGQLEIGLHGSPQSAFDPVRLEEELANLRAIGFDPQGYRTHYLHFDYQKSFTILENAGIRYDSTLGYWENLGFRAGISFPFYPFNIEENRPFRVLEIPLIVMDTTLYSKKAMNLSLIRASRSLHRLIDLAEKYQSHLSLLWHNTTFDPVDYPLWGWLYWNTIKYALKKRGWVSSLHKVYEEWVNLSY